jgi:hypothetical protein
VGVNAGFESAQDASMTAEGTHTNDFVWAVRLAKIHKGILSKNWSMQTSTQKATFGGDEPDIDVKGTVTMEGVKDFKVVIDGDLGQLIIL